MQHKRNKLPKHVIIKLILAIISIILSVVPYLGVLVYIITFIYIFNDNKNDVMELSKNKTVDWILRIWFIASPIIQLFFTKIWVYIILYILGFIIYVKTRPKSTINTRNTQYNNTNSYKNLYSTNTTADNNKIIEKNNTFDQTKINELKNNIQKLKDELNALTITEFISQSTKKDKNLHKGAQFYSGFKLKNIKELSDKIDNDLKELNINESTKNKTNMLIGTKAFEISKQNDLFKNISKELTKLSNKIDDKYVFIATIAQLRAYNKKLKEIEKLL